MAVTVDENRNTTLYLNGVRQSTFQGASGTPRYDAGSIVIGNYWKWNRETWGGATFNGCIDEVRIFDGVSIPAVVDPITRLCELAVPEPDNTPPTLAIDAAGAIDEGNTFVTTGRFDDVDADDAWSLMVDYYDDDGGFVDLMFDANHDFVLSHIYADDRVAPYEIEVTVDDGSGLVSAATTVVVNNVAPVLSDLEEAVIVAGESYTSSVTFTDPGADLWTVEIDYGDGSPVDTQTFDGTSWATGSTTVDLSHLYTANEQCGPFSVTVRVNDGDGGEDSSDAEVTVTHEVTVENASVRPDLRRRSGHDQYDVGSRLPTSLVDCVGQGDPVTIEFAGLALEVPAEALIRNDDELGAKWVFNTVGKPSGIRRLVVHGDGRFSVMVRGASFGVSRHDFPRTADFSIAFGTDVAKAVVELDSLLRLKRVSGG